MSTRRLLLISNSTMFGQGFLDHAARDIQDLLGPGGHVLFVPFALHDRPAYTQRVRARLEPLGYRVSGADQAGDRRGSVDAVFVGGGNTFRLLKALHDRALIAPIREHVAAGRPYIGSSAGAIVAGPTIRTTKDMPIVEPPSFDALALVPFQISPHFLDPDPSSTHMGETQEERIHQFLEENDTPVLGLREGGMVRIEGDSVVLRGTTAARLFARGRPPVEARPGTALGPLLVPEGPLSGSGRAGLADSEPRR